MLATFAWLLAAALVLAIFQQLQSMRRLIGLATMLGRHRLDFAEAFVQQLVIFGFAHDSNDTESQLLDKAGGGLRLTLCSYGA